MKNNLYLGLSGDEIFIKNNHAYKICHTNQQRFIKNINKQKDFVNPYIEAVPIYQISNVNNKYCIKMPYLKCPNAVEWISSADTLDIHKISEKILLYIEHLIHNSNSIEFEYSKWYEKIDELKNKIIDKDILNILKMLSNITFKNKLYYGNYHGDLTLSNIFIYLENEKPTIQTIDFLESFIHSPINDVVKIRQDTKHLWTMHLLNNKDNIDIPRVLIFLSHLDKKIINVINKDSILSEYYKPFQLLNLIRILPYNKNKKTLEYLKNEIQNVNCSMTL